MEWGSALTFIYSRITALSNYGFEFILIRYYSNALFFKSSLTSISLFSNPQQLFSIRSKIESNCMHNDTLLKK